MAEWSNDLGGWIQGVLYPRWRDNRRAAERKWRQNLAAYRIRSDLSQAATSANGEREPGDIGYPVTRQKVTTGHAALKDVVLPANKLAFMLVPQNQEDAALLDQSRTQAPPPAPEPLPPEGEMDADGYPLGEEPAAVEPPQDRAREIQDDVSAAEELIVEQLEACDGPEEVNQAIFSGCLYGRMWMKRSIGTVRREEFVEAAPGTFIPELTEAEGVAIEAVDPWSMYWDMEARRLEDGEGVLHRTHLSPYDLRQSIDKPLYDRSAIERVLKETVHATGLGTDGEDTPKRQAVQETSRSIETLEHWGLAPARLVAAYEKQTAEGRAGEAPDVDASAGPAADVEDQQAGRMVECHAIVCMTGGESGGARVIRFARTERRDRPYYTADLIWEPDDLVGSGIADTVSNEQRVLNDLVKAIASNADQAARLILGVRRAMGEGTLDVSRKGDAIVVELKESSTTDVKEVFSQFQVRTALSELLAVFNLFLASADLSSGIPRAEQGNQEPTPQTLGELRERLSRAGKFLGAILLNIDRMVEDIVRDFYRWNLLNPDVRHGKGLYRVKALGYAGFMSKYEKVAGMLRLLELALTHPKLERETNIRRAWADVIRAHDVDPDEFLLTPAQVAAAMEVAEEAARQEAEAAAAQAGGGPAPVEQGPSPAEEAALAATSAAEQAETQRRLADADLKSASAEEKRTSTLIKRVEAAARAMGGPAPISPGDAGAMRGGTA